MQKFGEHEQASTLINFASKGKILRAVKNFNGPFITPTIQILDRQTGVAFELFNSNGVYGDGGDDDDDDDNHHKSDQHQISPCNANALSEWS